MLLLNLLESIRQERNNSFELVNHYLAAKLAANVLLPYTHIICTIFFHSIDNVRILSENSLGQQNLFMA
ncbi:hypothetical protein K1719_032257 [Acacia pycnantha]|nr:hypothetical protein K1719_032257 [Acacia pycnantha]